MGITLCSAFKNLLRKLYIRCPFTPTMVTLEPETDLYAVSPTTDQQAVSPPTASHPVPYTKDFILEEVTLEEFEKMERFWSKHIKKPDRERYARVVNPIHDTEYERLLRRMMVHPLDVEVYVHDHGQWRKTYKRRCTETVIQDFARIAAADQRHRNYLEVKLCEEWNQQDWWNKAVLEFVEYRGRIIGYDVIVPRLLQSQFTLRFPDEPTGKVHGLWVPG